MPAFSRPPRWNEAFALEAFFAELSRQADALAGDERTKLEARIQTARELMGGRDAVDRFLLWSVPSDADAAPSGEELDDDGDS